MVGARRGGDGLGRGHIAAIAVGAVLLALASLYICAACVVRHWCLRAPPEVRAAAASCVALPALLCVHA